LTEDQFNLILSFTASKTEPVPENKLANTGNAKTIEVGGIATLNIQMDNANGTPIRNAASRFRFELKGGSDSQATQFSQSVSVQENNSKAGEYIISFSIGFAGTFQVYIYFDNQLISKDPFNFRVVSSLSSASDKSKEDAVLGLGESVSFDVNIKDYDGKPLTGGKGALQVMILGPDSDNNSNLTYTVDETSAGQYSIRFTPKTGGVYKVFVKNNGINVLSDPFIVRIDSSIIGGVRVQGEKDVSQSLEAVNKNAGAANAPQFYVGQRMSVTLDMKDPQGQRLKAGESRFRIELETPSSGRITSGSAQAKEYGIEIKEKKEGNYEMSFLGAKAGGYRMFIYFEGKLIQVKPFEFNVVNDDRQRRQVVDVNETERDVQVTFEAREDSGAPATGKSTKDFEINITDEKGNQVREFQVEEQTKGSGKYALKFTSYKVGGTYSLVIKFNGSTIAKKSFNAFSDK